jgi:hypothetical protein
MANTPKEELIERTDRARAAGRAVVIAPPMSRERMADLAAKCGVALPGQIRELVGYAAGFFVDGFAVDFGGEEPFELENAFPCPIAIAADGAGNFWVVDVTAGGWGPVFLVAHDPPVVVLQARDIGAFIDQVFDASETIDIVGLFAREMIWKRNPYVIPYEIALASADTTLREFALQLGDRFAIADLRDVTRGKGFVWGLAGPNAEVRRAGNHLLFAVEQKKRGVLSHLFSR